MIRTLVEIRNGRVSIQENADETTVTVTVDGATSSLGPDRTPTWRDSLNRDQLLTEIERLEAGLERYRKAHVCTMECKTERDRADQNKAWAERTESELDRRTQERDEREAARATLDQENAWLHRIVQQVNLEVHGPEILAALETTWERRSETMDETLANAVRKVRQIVTASRPGTSQA